MGRSLRAFLGKVSVARALARRPRQHGRSADIAFRAKSAIKDRNYSADLAAFKATIEHQLVSSPTGPKAEQLLRQRDIIAALQRNQQPVHQPQLIAAALLQ